MTRTLILLLACTIAAIQDPPPSRDPWAGFPEGSWVIIETTEKVGETSKSFREKILLKSLGGQGGATVREVRREKDGAYSEPGGDRMHVSGLPVSQGAGIPSKPKSIELEIGGRKIACELTEYELKEPDKELEAKTAVWRSKDIKIPYRELLRDGPDFALDPDIVQIELTLKRGTEHQSYKSSIIELDHKLKVGDKEMACVIEEVVEERKGKLHLKGTERRWLSDAIPGRILRAEGRGEANGKNMARIRQVIDFELKK